MTADTITIDRMTDLEDILQESIHIVRRIRLEALEGIVSTATAAETINHLAETIKQAAQ